MKDVKENSVDRLGQ